MTGKISDPFYMLPNSTSQGSETFVRNRQVTFFKEVWMTAGRTKYVPLTSTCIVSRIRSIHQLQKGVMRIDQSPSY
jgi:hypothetical protein